MNNQGFGCMGLTGCYTKEQVPVTSEQAKRVSHHAVESGVTLFNSSTFYGELNEIGFGANLRMLKTCIEGLDRSSFQLMVKVGMDTRCPVEKTGTSFVMKGDAEYLRKDIDYALEQLGVDYIDIVVLCRVPSNTPIEESVLALKEAVESGKARHIGLSEASGNIIRRAHAVHPIYCIEQEWSLWSRDIEDEIVPVCRELGVKIVAYSPLGRGFLTGIFKGRNDPKFAEKDFRLAASPKFSEANFDSNLRLVERVEALAAKKSISVGQLALAWLHAQGPDVIPIPGTTSIAHFDANYAALKVVLTAEDLQEIDSIFRPDAVQGDRYHNVALTFHANK